MANKEEYHERVSAACSSNDSGRPAGCGGGSSKETYKSTGSRQDRNQIIGQGQTAEGSDKPLRVAYLCNGSLGDKGFK